MRATALSVMEQQRATRSFYEEQTVGSVAGELNGLLQRGYRAARREPYTGVMQDPVPEAHASRLQGCGI
jgi:hypothetical protein